MAIGVGDGVVLLCVKQNGLFSTHLGDVRLPEDFCSGILTLKIETYVPFISPEKQPSGVYSVYHPA